MPLIAVTADHRPPRTDVASTSTRRFRPPRAEIYVNERIVERVREAGASVILFPPGDPALAAVLDKVDGLVVTGGAFDIDPRHYGQPIRTRHDGLDEARTATELAVARAALERGLPYLGICGGMQLMAVALGGSLIQDILTERPGSLDHEQPGDPVLPSHPIRVEPGLEGLLGEAVNSTHHQAIAELGRLKAVAWAPDGIIEAVTLPEHPFAVGVQWHPEWLSGVLFKALVEAALQR
jgi:putative glutamine amidotransferase